MFYLHMKGAEKTLILSNEDSNISFYLYKIVEQLLYLSNVELVGAFYLIFILNMGPFFIWDFFFFLPEPQAFACMA